jgi:hypothetical protein
MRCEMMRVTSIEAEFDHATGEAERVGSVSDRLR